MENVKMVCPKCGFMRFYALVQIEHKAVVDENRECVSICEDGVVVHEPDEKDTWRCIRCGYEGPGAKFERKAPKSIEEAFLDFLKGHSADVAKKMNCSEEELCRFIGEKCLERETKKPVQKEPVKEETFPVDDRMDAHTEDLWVYINGGGIDD